MVFVIRSRSRSLAARMTWPTRKQAVAWWTAPESAVPKIPAMCAAAHPPDQDRNEGLGRLSVRRILARPLSSLQLVTVKSPLVKKARFQGQEFIKPGSTSRRRQVNMG